MPKQRRNRGQRRPSQWPVAVVNRLRVLHAQGTTMLAMGRELSAMPEADRVYTKGSVVGMCHRLDLPRRQSSGPRTLKETTRRPRSRSGRKVKPVVPLYLAWAPRVLPLLLTWAGPVVVEATTSEPAAPPWEDIPLPPPPEPVPQPAPVPQQSAMVEENACMIQPIPESAPGSNVVVFPGKPGCQFPIGHPRTPGFRFCNAQTWSCYDPTESPTYCETHYRLTHVPGLGRQIKERQLRRA